MDIYTHVSDGLERDAADLLDAALGWPDPLVTPLVTDAVDAVVESRQEQPEVGPVVQESGSGGRTRTYDQAWPGNHVTPEFGT